MFEIRKLSSITRFDNESQKKVASLPILVLDSRSRFADLSFHSQLWLQFRAFLDWDTVLTLGEDVSRQ